MKFSAKSNIWLLPVAVFIVCVVLWELICRLIDIPSYLIPRPLLLISKMNSVGPDIFSDVFITALEAALGFLFGSALAILFGVLFASYNMIELSFMPYAVALKTVPIIAIAPLLLIWFGYGIAAKVILAALTCFFPVLVSTVQGLKNVDSRSVDLFNSLAASKWKTLIWLRWPSALCNIFASFKVAIVFAVIGAIVAEFAGAKNGIGFRILVASYNSDTIKMFVYIIISALLSLSFYGVITILEKILIPWKKEV
jgi:NitT/TauT family transport system permease protein